MEDKQNLVKKFIEQASKEDLEELLWLEKNPEYEERPVDIETFIKSNDYLNLSEHIRQRILDELKVIFPETPKGGKVSTYLEVVLMCGIGWGKTYFSALLMIYMIYLVLCMKNPQKFYGLSPGTPIHFMLMSNSERQARDVIFTNMKTLIDNSPWFQLGGRAYDQNIQTQLIFPKQIYLIPGNSQETFFEGYNILGGIIDEADAHKKTPEKDYAEEGYRAITRRIVSRFQDKGVIVIIGSPKTIDGFLMTRFKAGEEDPVVLTKSVPTWDSLEGTGRLSGKTFDFTHVMIGKYRKSDDCTMHIPIEYKRQFDENPEKALRDLAAIPFYAVSPYFTMIDKVENYPQTRPIPYDENNVLYDWFEGESAKNYWMHIDLASKHDSVGVGLGHIEDFKQFEGEWRPVVDLDMLMRIQAPVGGEILFGDIRHLIYNLIKRNFNIIKVTFDGWQSIEMMQQLTQQGVNCELLSVDKTMIPYENLKQTMYESRFQSHEMKKFVEELLHLELIEGKKIDHPAKGSKDVSDAAAGTVHNIVTSSEARSGDALITPSFTGSRVFKN